VNGFRQSDILKTSRHQTVVVTGASAGVGRAVAHRFAQAGARLGLIARDVDALNEVRNEVEDLGGSAIVAAADVADADAVFAAADLIQSRFGPADVWINDAMVTVFSPVWEISAEEFRRVTEVTYLGVVHGTMAALRQMRPRNRGTIIQVGSSLAYRGIPLQAAYCGAKHAIRGFTNALRAELIHDRSNINLTIVELPAVNTPQFDWARTHMPRQPRPVPPVVQPEVIARAVFRAAAAPRREYWVGLSTFKIILGNMLLPAFLDRYLARAAYDAQETQLPVAFGRQDNLMRPIRELHRTRGSFGREARSHAALVLGPVARLGSVLAGGLLLISIGLVAGRASTHRGAASRRR
jgi:NADP-dependent 3-hydroxy acid dehydrogenase YdfG